MEQATQNGTFATSDLDIAAWLKLNKFEVIEASRSQKDRKKFRFVFKDTDHRATQMIIEFAGSQAHGFANALRTMKMLMHK
jgi:hypothetical protein